MKTLPPNTELLTAVVHFTADLKRGRERLAAALDLPVSGDLHQRLQVIAAAALAAAKPELDPRLADLRDLVRRIGIEADLRLKSRAIAEQAGQSGWLPFADI
jgi:hypothetical protein